MRCQQWYLLLQKCIANTLARVRQFNWSVSLMNMKSLSPLTWLFSQRDCLIEPTHVQQIFSLPLPSTQGSTTTRSTVLLSFIWVNDYSKVLNKKCLLPFKNINTRKIQFSYVYVSYLGISQICFKYT